MVDQESLEEIYGPLARHSEHQIGDTIRYLNEGQTKTGKIVWMCAPGRIGDREIGVTYAVDLPGGGWPDMVFPGDVLMSDLGQLNFAFFCAFCSSKTLPFILFDGTVVVARCPL